MKIKKSNIIGERNLETLKKEQEEWIEVLNNAKAELDKIAVEKANIELAPFRIDGDVMCELKIGRSKKWRRCKLKFEVFGLGEYRVYVIPYSNDGVLSKRKFNLYHENGLSIKDQLRKVNG